MKRLKLAFVFAFSAIAAFAQMLPNPGFEEESVGWSFDKNRMSTVCKEAARTGKFGLRVIDASDRDGSSCRSDAVKIKPNAYYRLRFHVRNFGDKSESIGVYFKFQDANGQELESNKARNELIHYVNTKTVNEWAEMTACFQSPKTAATLAVWIHSFSTGMAKMDFDDFILDEVPEAEGKKIASRPPTRFDPPDPDRVKEIAGWLPPHPAAPGDPIAVRTHWDALARTPDGINKIRQAERVQKEKFPDVPDEWYLEFTKTGNRNHFERPYGQRMRQISALFIGECLENKGRFIEALETRILAVCEERSWVMPAHDGALGNFNRTKLHVDLGSSARGWMLSIVYSTLGEKLSPAVRERIKSEVYRRILTPYLNALRSGDPNGNWWMIGDNNWNAVCHAGVTGCSLALMDKPEDRAEILAAVEKFNPIFISGFTNDGYCSEGMGYWNYGFGHEVMMGLEIRAATQGKLDILSGDKTRRIAGYAFRYQIEPGHCPYFADGGGAPSQEVWATMRQVWPECVPDKIADYPILGGSVQQLLLRGFGQEPPRPANPQPERMEIRDWFPDAEVLICRQSGDCPVKFGLGVKGGHNNEQHNHNDVGSYTIVLDGLEMLGDPGGEVYTRRTFSGHRYESKVLNSYGHPVPVVNGQLQPPGRKYAAKMLKADFSDQLDVLEIDLTGAYKCPELKRLVRSVSYDRENRTVTISDRVEFSKPCSFSSPIITYRDIVPGDGPNRFTLTDGKNHRVKLEFKTDRPHFRFEDETIENPGKPSPKRKAATFDGNDSVTVATATWVISVDK